MNDEVAQKAAWRVRLVIAIIERKFDDETLVQMLNAGLAQAHSEGLQDAATICDRIAAARPTAAKVATILAAAIRILDRMNKSGAVA